MERLALGGKRVTVTGGAGFLGRAVVGRLRGLGADVFVPRRDVYDLVEAEAVRRMYAQARPEVLIHLAATVGGIGANRASPGRYFYENMAMGLHALEEARRYGGLKKLVLIGTACAYPKFAPIPFQEQALWDGYPEETNAPYGVAKRTLLVMAEAYGAQYGLRSAYLIPTNLYGPGDHFDLESGHVIPALIRKFLEAEDDGDEQVTVWGTGSATREFLYVDDAAEGIVAATEAYEGLGPVNLSGCGEVSIRELVEILRRLTGYRGNVVWDQSKPDGQPRRRLDGTLAKRAFGFEARTPLEEGLRRTIAWYRMQQVTATR